jgi:hypothetical protein
MKFTYNVSIERMTPLEADGMKWGIERIVNRQNGLFVVPVSIVQSEDLGGMEIEFQIRKFETMQAFRLFEFMQAYTEALGLYLGGGFRHGS